MDRFNKVSMYVIIGCCVLGLLMSALALKWTAFLWGTALFGWLNYREVRAREEKLVEKLQFDVDMMTMMLQEIDYLRTQCEGKRQGDTIEGEVIHEST